MARTDLLHGTLDALILRAVRTRPLHGYAISQWLNDHSCSAFEVLEGSLYPALYRLEREGFLTAAWGTSDLGRRAKFYQITPTGRGHLETEAERFQAFAAAVTPLLQT